MPPRKLRMLVGPFSDPRLFVMVQKEFFIYFKDLCSLKPEEDVLDIGCGCGQMAIPLITYLNRGSLYEGFDIIPSLIKWCQKNISSKYKNFNFRTADVYNRFYNPNGKYQASQYEFPYMNESFDFLIAKSVFTHMLPSEMENYFSNAARVLKSGGRCLFSFFLLNNESLEMMNASKCTLDFKYDFEKYRVVNAASPEEAVGYEETFVLDLYRKYGLRVTYPIHYGSWCGRPKILSYQDIVVACKE
jgi:SAM-dependent methyltransferase